MATRMQQRRGTASQWTTANPILNAGEIGWESDTNKFKVGDGTNHWEDLPYFVDEGSINVELDGYVETSSLAQPDGVATLDENGKLELAQLPAVTITSVHVVADETERLALDVQPGDVAIQTDVAVTYMLAATPASEENNWIVVSTSNPFETRTTDDLSEGDNNLYFTEKRARDSVGYAVGTGLSYDQQAESISVTPNTYDEYGAASTAQSNAESYADSAVLDHSNETTNIHGISNTADLATKSYADQVAEQEATSAASSAVSSHTALSTGIHGVTGDVVGTNDVQTLTNKTISSADNTITITTSNISDITASAGELNILDGVTATASELNVLDGITASTSEINVLEGITASTAELNILDGVSATASEINVLSGLTASTAELNYVNGVTSSVQTQLDGKLDKSGGTMTGFITLHADPTQALHAATKEYVDNVSAGILAKPSADVATTANVTATYNNGTAGVGATLTVAATATLDIDGKTSWLQYDSVLFKDQTDAAENGRYVLTTVGDAETAWVFTRCGLCDEASEIPGAYVFVTDGTINGQTAWVQHVDDPATFVVGTDDIDVYQFSGAGTYSAGTGLELNGTVFSVDTTVIADTSTVQTLTNKTIALGSNTVSGTIAEFNSAVTDADFATIDGTETLTNKTLTSPTVSTPALTLSTTTSTTDGRIAWDSYNKKIIVGNGSSALQFSPSTIQINQTSGSYTLVGVDKDQMVELSSSSAMTLTVPTDASVENAFPVGTKITILQTGAGQVTIAGASGVTVNGTPGLKLRAQWASATLIKRAANTWVATGDLVA